MGRHGVEQRLHQLDVDHARLVRDDEVGAERIGFLAPELAGGRIDLEQAVDRLGLAAGALGHALGGPPGRARRARCRPRGTRSARMIVSMIVVLPTPGPPVMTRSFAPSAVSTASACAGGQALAGPRLGGEHGVREPVGPPGRRPGGQEPSRRSAIAFSAFHSCGRK